VRFDARSGSEANIPELSDSSERLKSTFHNTGSANDRFWRKAGVRDGHLRIDLFVWNPCVMQCVRKE
jgi:hypothetical protein